MPERPSGSALADLAAWAEDRNLVVKTSSGSYHHRVGIYERSGSQALIERLSEVSADQAAVYLTNALSRLGIGPNPWPKEMMTRG